MSKRDLTLALLVVIIWGANFTVIKLGLGGVPPMLLITLRYLLATVPAIFFVKPPTVGWRYVVLYGIAVGVGQFACLFYAMSIGMPASVASVLLQSQAFFTLLLSGFLLKESIKPVQIAGLAVAGCGLFFIGGNFGSAAGTASIPLFPFLLTLLAAAFWGLSNIAVRYADKASSNQGNKLDMLSLVVWSSLVPPLPLLGLALLLDKPATLLHAITNLNMTSVFAVLYLAFGSTLFCYYTWSTLLAKYPTGKVAPLSMLVPIAGLLTARLVLGEQLSPMQWLGCLIIFVGLMIANFGDSLIQRILKVKEA